MNCRGILGESPGRCTGLLFTALGTFMKLTGGDQEYISNAVQGRFP